MILRGLLYFTTCLCIFFSCIQVWKFTLEYKYDLRLTIGQYVIYIITSVEKRKLFEGEQTDFFCVDFTIIYSCIKYIVTWVRFKIPFSPSRCTPILGVNPLLPLFRLFGRVVGTLRQRTSVSLLKDFRSGFALACPFSCARNIG